MIFCTTILYTCWSRLPTEYEIDGFRTVSAWYQCPPSLTGRLTCYPWMHGIIQLHYESRVKKCSCFEDNPVSAQTGSTMDCPHGEDGFSYLWCCIIDRGASSCVINDEPEFRNGVTLFFQMNPSFAYSITLVTHPCLVASGIMHIASLHSTSYWPIIWRGTIGYRSQ